MKIHTKVYLYYFGYGEQDNILCEIPGCADAGVDIHHVEPKGMGGRKTYMLNGKECDINAIENLIALCRKDHEKAHAGIYSKEYLRSVHKQTMENR